jgi:beta-lactamase regulating signal transducer with metallopeptidase domain
MIIYILKSTFCLVLLLGFYHLILEKEKMHRFNRFYLLGCILFSFLVPSFTITVAPVVLETAVLTETASINQISADATPQQQIIESLDYTKYIIGLYSLISSILLILLSKKVYQLLNKVKRNQHINYFTATVVLLKERIVPYTFLHYIFINKHTYQTESVEEQILTHELAHVEQKHSIDVLFIEVLLNLFWFNPFFRYYKKAIQLNHEFLADDAVIKSHKNITEYQQVLLNTTAQNNNIYLASNLNYSLTKKRLLMMTTPSSKTKILLKKLMVIPLIAGFTFAFAQRIEAQEKLPQVVEIKKQGRGLSKKGINEYKLLFNKGKKSKIYKQKDVSKMIVLFDSMSREQQKSITDIRELLPPQPHKSQITEAIEIIETPIIEETVELKELTEVKELVEVRELKEVEEIPEAIELTEIITEMEEVPEVIEIIENSAVTNNRTKVAKLRQITDHILPPPALKKNATRKEKKRYQKAYRLWKQKTKNIPPPPISPLDQVIKMAKKGAKFKYNGKIVSSDKAIYLLKKNKKLSIYTLDKKGEKPIIHITSKPIIIETKN